MKNFITFSLLAVALTACDNTPKGYVITGSVADTTLNGQKIVLCDINRDNVAVDSVTIANGKFEMKGQADTTTIYELSLGRKRALIIGANEAINVKVGDPKIDVSSTGINGRFSQYMKDIKSLQTGYSSVYDSLKRVYGENQDTIAKLIEADYKKFQLNMEMLQDRTIAENKDNMIGAFCVLTKAYSLSLKELDSLIALVPKTATLKPVVEYRDQKIKAENTAEGKKFVDFKAKDISGKDIALSDFVGKGNYVLVDFWASWCGPCKREIPNLKKLYDELKDKGLIVLGVNVWDKEDAFKKAIEEEGMTWSMMYASGDKTATDLYGISGIPQIILFAPDGTIKYRNLRGDDMIAKVKAECEIQK